MPHKKNSKRGRCRGGRYRGGGTEEGGAGEEHTEKGGEEELRAGEKVKREK